MDADELKRGYAAGDRDFTGANLNRAKLVGANLLSQSCSQPEWS